MNLSKYRKGIVAVTAALGVLVTALSDGVVDVSEVIQVVLAGLGAAGVIAVANKPDAA